MGELFRKLLDFFKNEERHRKIWSKPDTRKALLEKLADAGFSREQLHIMQSLINIEIQHPRRRPANLRQRPSHSKYFH